MIFKPRIETPLNNETPIHPVLEYIYKRRNIKNAKELELKLALLVHPNLLYGVQEACPIIYEAMLSHKKIVIVGDFDVDGATSTALLMRGFAAFGIRMLDYIIPDRFDDGYGLSQSVVDKARKLDAELIITVDNGISANEAVDYANQQGIKVIITDHHLAPEKLPNAAAIINPQQPDCLFPSKNLSGVGVAFYVLLALRTYLRDKNWFEQLKIKEFNLTHLLDLVALGTVADVVTLDHNNRILVHYGLERIRQKKCIAGINALLKVIGKENNQISSQDLGYYLGPRINAAGRMDNMSIGVELLLTDDPVKADEIAELLNELNIERKNVEKQMQSRAKQLLKTMQFDEENLPNSLVVFHDDFHEGVIGLLSSRLKDRFYRPVFSFAKNVNGILKGSGRSIPGIHLRNALEKISQQNEDLILAFGGHAMAAGLTIKEEDLPLFKKQLEHVISEDLLPETLLPVIETDGELPKQFLNYGIAQFLKQSVPWGSGFPEPIFQGKFKILRQRLIGADKNHLKLVLTDDNKSYLDAVLFNCDNEYWQAHSPQNIAITYRLDPNEYQGQKSVNLLIQNLEILD